MTAQTNQIPFSPNLPLVTLATDGACQPNPGVGAWAYVLRFGTAYKELSGLASTETTNNRMEMQAIVEGLRAIKRPCRVVVRTDSAVCLGVLNGTGKKPGKRKNPDLVQAMLEAMQPHVVTGVLIKGHSGDIDNERCDRLAVGAIRAATASSQNTPKPTPC